MSDGSTRLHIITERDVGLFSLIQQVISNIPWAIAEDRVPVVHFADGTCYWTPNGYQGRDTVWEYYFEPLDPTYPTARIPDHVKRIISVNRPSPFEVGYYADDHVFVSCHFGDHPQLRGATLRIPYEWDDPSESLRREAKAVLDRFVRPRAYILDKVSDFFARQHGRPLRCRSARTGNRCDVRTGASGSSAGAPSCCHDTAQRSNGYWNFSRMRRSSWRRTSSLR